MKKILSIIGLMLMPFVLAAQIRNYVGIVREQYHPEIVSFLKDFQNALDANGYSSYAKSIERYLEGSFGSGFVYVDANGNNYIITNRHVVSQAVTASIEFEDANTDTTKKYENLTVVVLDEDIDLAVLKFNNNEKPFKTGLPISTTTITDGQVVWSAGYPGLAGQPIWQLGKGTVTNSRAKIKELLDPSISSIIQHSAEIDGGNSGGPLLISSKNAIGYEVIGINTWKDTSRQNTNFAIPAKLIDTLLKKVNTQNSSINTDEIKTRTEKMMELLNNKDENFTSIVKYISDEVTLERGKENFIEAVRYASSTDRALIADAFSYSPLEGMRYSVAYKLWQNFSSKNNNGTDLTITLADMEESLYKVQYSLNNTKKFTCIWENEKSIWRIKSFEIDGEKKSNSSRSKLNKDKKDSDISINSNIIFDFSIAGGFSPSFDYSSIKFNLDYQFSTYTGFTTMFTIFLPGTDFSLKYFGSGFGLKIPVNIHNKVQLDIFGNIGIGGTFNPNLDKETFLGYFAESGIKCFFLNSSGTYPGIGISYSFTQLNEFMDDENKLKFNEIKIYGIIAF